jgi:RNA polymerase sigma factor (sigma-70 family)
MNDAEYVAAIRSGDRVALGRLLERYREQAVRWAAAVTGDPHIAQDIAHDALLLAMARLDQLRDPARFGGWLRQSVRGHALNKLKQLRREAPNREAAELADRMADAGGDPQQLTVEEVSLQELLASAIEPLSARNRAVMLELAEGADTEQLLQRYEMTRGNLYNLISRSRTKIGEERYHASLDAYLKARRIEGRCRQAMLEEPKRSRPYSMFGIAVHESLRYELTASPLEVTETMGITGEAFRLSMTAGCHWRGISTYDWTHTAQRAVERLGRKGRLFARKRSDPITPERHIELLRLIHENIDRGVPVIAWNLVMNEFGLVYGYDDREGLLHYRGFGHEKQTRRYIEFGRNHEESELFALAIGGQTAPRVSDGDMIRHIVKHAKGEETPVPGFAYGLHAYRLWKAAAVLRELDPLGHAYQVAILCEAREHAGNYLRLLGARSKSQSMRDGLISAAASYDHALHAMRKLYPSFPYGYGVGSGNREGNERIVHGIEEALAAESEAIERIEELL